jgi:hypothetical protein
MPDQNTRGQAAAAQAVTVTPFGVGTSLAAVPTGTVNGAPIPFPTGDTETQGVRFYLPPGSTVNIAIAASQPVSAPVSFAIVNASNSASSWDEALYDQNLIYITGTTTGNVLYRWI